MNNKPEVTRIGLASLQVCVPREFTDEQVEAFANGAQMTGLDHGWSIRREGDSALAGAHERVDCEGRSGCVHVMLYC